MNNWQTTGVGSLPFVDSAEAIQYVSSAYTIPFYPQLVQHERFSKNPLPQMLQEAVPSAVLNLFADKSATIKTPAHLATLWDNEIPAHIAELPAIQEFSKTLSGLKGRFFKLQLIGPKTTIYFLEKLYGQKIDRDVQKVITEGLQKYGERLRKQCSPGNKKALMIIDEPFSPDVQNLNTFQFENTVLGIHCCGKFALGNIVDSFNKAYLSFDINQHSINQNLFTNIAKLRNNGGLMLGIVDTTKKSVDAQTCKKILDNLSHHVQVDSSNATIFPSILTGGCGTGTQSIAFEKQLSGVLKELKR
jgi:hypothetical protein